MELEPFNALWLAIGGVVGAGGFITTVRLYFSEFVVENVGDTVDYMLAGLLGTLISGIVVFVWPVLLAVLAVTGLFTAAAWAVSPKPRPRKSPQGSVPKSKPSSPSRPVYKCGHPIKDEVHNSYLGFVGYVCRDCGDSIRIVNGGRR